MVSLSVWLARSDGFLVSVRRLTAAVVAEALHVAFGVSGPPMKFFQCVVTALLSGKTLRVGERFLCFSSPVCITDVFNDVPYENDGAIPTASPLPFSLPFRSHSRTYFRTFSGG